MKKNMILAVLVCLLAVTAAGCGRSKVPDLVNATTISVDGNGKITYYFVGDFEREYYSLSELSDMAQGEAAEFNKGEAEPSVVVDRVETVPEDGTPDSRESRVLIVYQFSGAAGFNQFNQKVNKGPGTFFYGTVEEAIGLGLVEDVSLKSVKDGSLKTEEQLGQEGKKKLIITDEKAVIYCPGKVAFLSEGAALNQDGSVDASGAEKTVYILLK